MKLDDALVHYFDEWEQILPQDAREALRPLAEEARRTSRGKPDREEPRGPKEIPLD